MLQLVRAFQFNDTQLQFCIVCEDYFLFISYLAGDCGRLEKGGGPGPLRDDGGGGQPDGHLAARIESRVQVVCVVVNVFAYLKTLIIAQPSQNPRLGVPYL